MAEVDEVLVAARLEEDAVAGGSLEVGRAAFLEVVGEVRRVAAGLVRAEVRLEVGFRGAAVALVGAEDEAVIKSPAWASSY